MDVISSHQAGVKEAVATSGTAMTEQHLKILSHLTQDIRLAFDGDSAGVKATERAIMLAGDLGIDLSVISNYHGAKDPDELIQKDPALWKAAVEERIPAVDWLLNKYEENLDLRLAPDKRKYSDVALKLLSYVKDEVERASYEEKIAKKLGVETKVLREKGERLEQKLEQASRKFFKKAKTVVKSTKLQKMESSLLAIKKCGGLDMIIPIDLPTEKEKLEELDLVFANEHEHGTDNLAEEAEMLLEKYNAEMRKEKIKALNDELASLDENDERFTEVLREIRDLQNLKN